MVAVVEQAVRSRMDARSKVPTSIILELRNWHSNQDLGYGLVTTPTVARGDIFCFCRQNPTPVLRISTNLQVRVRHALD